jgi:PAS domain-containing protein
MAVVVGVSLETAYQPISGLAALAHGEAVVATWIVLVIAAIIVWTIWTMRAAKQRQRARDRLEVDLVNVRQELARAQTRALLNEPEAGALMSSTADGIARLDSGLRLRVWNPRFAELACVPLEETEHGLPMEAFLRRQAGAGLFGEEAEAEQEVATRLTILHASPQLVSAPVYHGPSGEPITMLVRGMVDGGYVVILAGPDNARLATLPPLPGEASEAEPETADETTEW